MLYIKGTLIQDVIGCSTIDNYCNHRNCAIRQKLRQFEVFDVVNDFLNISCGDVDEMRCDDNICQNVILV